jgi:hypothetical protein
VIHRELDDGGDVEMPRKRRDRKSSNQDLPLAIGDLRLRINYGPLAARNIGLRDTDLLSPFIVMLATTKTENPDSTDVCTNGTGSLIDTGQRRLLVTNHHVYDAFLKCRSEVPCSKLLMSGVDGTPFLTISDEQCVASDVTCDLAVLEIQPAIIERLGKRFYRSTSWPPKRPRKGAKVVVLGYPGQGRAPISSDSLGIMPLAIGRTVTSLSDRHFVLADEDGDAYTHAPEGPKPLTSYGGISGSAAYEFRSNPRGLGDFRLCGFAYEQSQSGAVYIAHADHINADGTIR